MKANSQYIFKVTKTVFEQNQHAHTHTDENSNFVYVMVLTKPAQLIARNAHILMLTGETTVYDETGFFLIPENTELMDYTFYVPVCNVTQVCSYTVIDYLHLPRERKKKFAKHFNNKKKLLVCSNIS